MHGLTHVQWLAVESDAFLQWIMHFPNILKTSLLCGYPGNVNYAKSIMQFLPSLD